MSRARLPALWMVPALLVGPAHTGAHPGRLDTTGCHLVRTPFVHKDGRAERVGDYHCHRVLGAIRLDGLERFSAEPPVPTAERLRDRVPHLWNAGAPLTPADLGGLR